jgi:predicted small lipoprotein YifL
MTRFRVTLAALAAAAALAACGEKTLNTGDAEKKIADVVEEQGGKRPENVECPGDMKAKKGETYDCKVFLGEGNQATAKLTMLDDEGRFSISVLTLQGSGAGP